MKTVYAILTVLVMGVLASFAIPQQINYQCYLTNSSGSPLDTVVSMTFSLYDAASGGMQLWTETQPSCSVRTGYSNTVLGSITAIPDSFDYDQVWLGVSVGNNIEMIPRTQLVSVPYAYRVKTIDGAYGGSIGGPVYIDTTLRAQGIQFFDGSIQWKAADTTGLATRTWIKSMGYLRGTNNYACSTAFVGGGNYNFARGDYSVIAGGGSSGIADSNSARGSNAYIGGGFHNNASGFAASIGGGQGNMNDGWMAVIGGGRFNHASGQTSTVGGGYLNWASGYFSTVSGGLCNLASDSAATVGGGSVNYARGKYSVVAGGGGTSYSDSNSAIGNYSVISGGRSNVALKEFGTVGGGWNNRNGGRSCFIGSGEDNLIYSFSWPGEYGSPPSLSFIGSGKGNRIRSSGVFLGDTLFEQSFIGSGEENMITDVEDWPSSGISRSFIGSGYQNRVSSSRSFIGSGWQNTIIGQLAANSFIGSGEQNQIDGPSESFIGSGMNNQIIGAGGGCVGAGYDNSAGTTAFVGSGNGNLAYGVSSVVCGGENNRARGQYSFVGGGGNSTASDSNSAGGAWSVIGGGYGNRATDTCTVVVGGCFNKAGGAYSFAAGRRAKANCRGSFVWADNHNSDFTVTTDNAFAARAFGGVSFVTGSSSGSYLASGSGTWQSLSDSTKKRNIRLVDTKQMLDKVKSLPIKQWSYRTQDPAIEHIGPMAQDFYAQFHIGDDSLTISTIDPSGIALAAIQELAKQNLKLQTSNFKLEAEVAQLRSIVEKLAANTTGEIKSAVYTPKGN